MQSLASMRERLAHFAILVAASKRRRRPSLGVVLALLCLIALAPSCASDECTALSKRCHANAVQFCEVDSTCESSFCRLSWQGDSACDTSATNGDASVCVAPTGVQAFCALSDARDPNCAGVFGYCSGASLTRCTDGFAVAREPCASPSVCSVAADRAPICALSASPDPRCTSGGGYFCDGAVVVTCSRGYAVRLETCPVACVTPGGADADPAAAVCALSAEPDARCGPDYFDGYCEADTHVSCERGYAVGRGACPVGLACAKLGCVL
jgi:hypothetical protein